MSDPVSFFQISNGNQFFSNQRILYLFNKNYPSTHYLHECTYKPLIWYQLIKDMSYHFILPASECSQLMNESIL